MLERCGDQSGVPLVLPVVGLETGGPEGHRLAGGGEPVGDSDGDGGHCHQEYFCCPVEALHSQAGEFVCSIDDGLEEGREITWRTRSQSGDD